MRGRRAHAAVGGAVALVLLGACATWPAGVPTGYYWSDGHDELDPPRWGPEWLTLDEDGTGRAFGLPVWTGDGECSDQTITTYAGDLTWTSRRERQHLVLVTLTPERGEPVTAYPGYYNGPIEDSPSWTVLTLAPCGLDVPGPEHVWGSPDLRGWLP